MESLHGSVALDIAMTEENAIESDAAAAGSNYFKIAWNYKDFIFIKEFGYLFSFMQCIVMTGIIGTGAYLYC